MGGPHERAYAIDGGIRERRCMRGGVWRIACSGPRSSCGGHGRVVRGSSPSEGSENLGELIMHIVPSEGPLLLSLLYSFPMEGYRHSDRISGVKGHRRCLHLIGKLSRVMDFFQPVIHSGSSQGSSWICDRLNAVHLGKRTYLESGRTVVPMRWRPTLSPDAVRIIQTESPESGLESSSIFTPVKESLNVTFDESPHPIKLSPLVDDDVGEEEAIENYTKVVNNNNEEDELIEVDEFINIKKFEMSMMGGLNFFLGLQIKQIKDEIFFNPSNYIKEMLKKFGLEDSKPTKTPMSTDIKLTKDDEADFVDSTKYEKFGLEDYKPTKTPMSTDIKLTKDDEADFVDSTKYERRVEDLQLGVKSYQKRLNLTKPDTYQSNLKQREAYTAYSNPKGFIYQNKYKKNRLMRIDELHKFSDGTLNDVRNALDDRLKGIRMQYLPQTIWRKGDKDKAATMIQAIEKMLKTRRIMRSLERFVGGRSYEGDFRMLQRTI
nr:retrovirus-related Pol polyprotein from transposon TNT 1-94 [Tanacetum cinerariifolium]